MEPKFIIWQAVIWDRFAKISPLIFLVCLGIFYYLGYRDWDLVIHIGMVFLMSIAVTWWFWVVYTIAIISIALNRSNKKLVDVLSEIKQAQRDIYDLRPRNRKRRESK